MSTNAPAKSVKVAIVGMTGSGKTVLISTLAMKMAQMALQDIFMYPSGNEENRRQTLRYTNTNWKTLNEGRWPASTPAGELIQLQWELATCNHQVQVQFLDCAGQDIRSLFHTDNFNPSKLGSDLKRVYENISTANVLIFLVNMKDLLAAPDYVEELMDMDQMFHTLNQRNGIPRKMAVVFSQYDKYKPEVDQMFNGDFLEYLRHYIPLLHGQYIRKRNFEIIPVAAVNDTQSVIEDGEVKQYPVPNFSSYNLEKLIHWIADSVEELAPAIHEYFIKNRKEEPNPNPYSKYPPTAYPPTAYPPTAYPPTNFPPTNLPKIPSLPPSEITRQLQSMFSSLSNSMYSLYSHICHLVKMFFFWFLALFCGISYTSFGGTFLGHFGYKIGGVICAVVFGAAGLLIGFYLIYILFKKLYNQWFENKK